MKALDRSQDQVTYSAGSRTLLQQTAISSLGSSGPPPTGNDELLAAGQIGHRRAGRVGRQFDLITSRSTCRKTHRCGSRLFQSPDRHVESRHRTRWRYNIPLHDDHHGLGHQRPAASEKPQPFADAGSLNCRAYARRARPGCASDARRCSCRWRRCCRTAA